MHALQIALLLTNLLLNTNHHLSLFSTAKQIQERKSARKKRKEKLTRKKLLPLSLRISETSYYVIRKKYEYFSVQFPLLSLTKSLIYIDIKRVDKINSHLIILKETKAQRWVRQVPESKDNLMAAQGPESKDHDPAQCFVQYSVLTPNYYVLQKYC